MGLIHTRLLIIVAMFPVCLGALSLCSGEKLIAASGSITSLQYPEWVDMYSCQCQFAIPENAPDSARIKLLLQLSTRSSTQTCMPLIQLESGNSAPLRSCPSQNTTTTTFIRTPPGKVLTLTLDNSDAILYHFHVNFSMFPLNLEVSIQCSEAAVLGSTITAAQVKTEVNSTKQKELIVVAVISVVVILTVVAVIVLAAVIRKKCLEPERKKIDEPKDRDDDGQCDNPAYEFTPKSSIHNLTLDSLKVGDPFTGSADLGVPQGPYRFNRSNNQTNSLPGTPHSGTGSVVSSIPYGQFGPAVISLSPDGGPHTTWYSPPTSPQSAVLEPSDYDSPTSQCSQNNKPNSAPFFNSPDSKTLPIVGSGALGNSRYYPHCPTNKEPEPTRGPPRSPEIPYVSNNPVETIRPENEQPRLNLPPTNKAPHDVHNHHPHHVGPASPSINPHPMGPATPSIQPHPMGPASPSIHPHHEGPASPSIHPHHVGPALPSIHPHHASPASPNIDPHHVGPTSPSIPHDKSLPCNTNPHINARPHQACSADGWPASNNAPGNSTRPQDASNFPGYNTTPDAPQALKRPSHPRASGSIHPPKNKNEEQQPCTPKPFNISFDDIKFIDDEDQDAWVRLGTNIKVGLPQNPRLQFI